MADSILLADLSVIERTRVPLDATPGPPRDGLQFRGLKWLLAKLPEGFATVLKGLPPATGDYQFVENFDMQTQCYTYWCWAAVASSIAKYFNSSSTCQQCTIANYQLNRNDCCSHPCHVPNLPYDQPSNLSLALEFVDCIDGAVSTEKPELAVVQAQITRKKPVAVRIVWGDPQAAEDSRNGAHFVVIVGFLPGTNRVAIKDPASGNRIRYDIDYENFPDNGHYNTKAKWGNTYYTKAGYKNCAP